MRRIVLYFFLLGVLSIPTQIASAESNSPKITVLSSIKPVQSIVNAIGGEYINSNLLIPAYISPHDYTFKPSDIRKIQSADLVFRIDEHFETMLNAAFDSLEDDSKVVSLGENPMIKLLPASGGHNHGEEDHAHMDMHIFTSPQNALIMAQEIADKLIKVDMRNTVAYRKNLSNFEDNIRNEVELIRLKLASVKERPFIVFHNSWQYFGEYFNLQKPTVIELHESVSTGVKRIMGIRKEMSSKGITCIFIEPSTPVKQIHRMIEGSVVKVVKIDVLEQEITMGENSYINWLKIMGDQVKQCLAFKKEPVKSL